MGIPLGAAGAIRNEVAHMLYAFVVTTIITTIAEQGDKTQVISFALAGKYHWWQVVGGVLLANLPLSLAYVLIGSFAGRLVPESWLLFLGALAFLVFGVLSLRPEEEEPEGSGHPKASGIPAYGPVLATATLLFLSQVGDHAALVTMAIASDPAGPLKALGSAGVSIASFLARIGLDGTGSLPWESLVGVWLGSVAGNVIADGFAVGAGTLIGRRMPDATLRRVSAWVFIVLGAVGLITLLVAVVR